jgi:hypothetical protein
MERELHLIELYVRQFEEARRLLQEETERAGSTELDGLLEDMDAKWNTLFRINEIVINGSAIEQLEARVGAMEASRSRYNRTRKAAEKKKEQVPITSSASGLSNTTHHVLAAAMGKLTAAKVPTFSGEMVKWQEFWGVFKLTVHQQRDMEKCTRSGEIHQVKGSLKRRSSVYHRRIAPDGRKLCRGSRAADPALRFYRSYHSRELSLYPQHAGGPAGRFCRSEAVFDQ